MTTHEFTVDGKAVSINTNTEAPKTANAPKQKRTRRFCINSYIDPSALRSFVTKAPWVQHWAMCTHDKDLWTEADEKENPEHKCGTPKKTHTHLILYTYDGKSSSAIKKIFDRFSADFYADGTPQNTRVEICNDVVAQWHYLVHKYDADKYQYSPNVRYCDDTLYWLELCKTNKLNDSVINYGLQMFDDMLNGTSTREMILRYGKEYIYHAHSFKECYIDHIREDNVKLRYMTEDSIESRDINQTAVNMRNALDGAYTHEQLLLFEKMVVHALNNLSVLENFKVVVIKGDNVNDTVC